MKYTRTTPPCSVSDLLLVFRYDRLSGDFYWLHDRPRARERTANKLAGSLDSRGYRCIRVNGHRHLAHRLVWYVETGEWPKLDIDHKDGSKSNNRFGNLRLATYAQNNHNRRVSSLNKSGVKGVCWVRSERKWRAMITAHGKRYFLGYYVSKDDAAAARISAAAIYHGEYMRIA